MDFIKDFPDYSFLNFTNKRVKIICTDGEELTGTILGFESALNNYRGATSLSLFYDKFQTTIEILETEIESIDLI